MQRESHDLYDIWEGEPGPLNLPWRAQLLNYFGYFPTRNAAETYVAAVKKEREKRGLK